jgi:hypothetical protein
MTHSSLIPHPFPGIDRTMASALGGNEVISSPIPQPVPESHSLLGGHEHSAERSVACISPMYFVLAGTSSSFIKENPALASSAIAVRFCSCCKLGASCPKDKLSTPYLFRGRALCYASLAIQRLLRSLFPLGPQENTRRIENMVLYSLVGLYASL